jgi:hypothetical protein
VLEWGGAYCNAHEEAPHEEVGTGHGSKRKEDLNLSEGCRTLGTLTFYGFATAQIKILFYQKGA